MNKRIGWNFVTGGHVIWDAPPPREYLDCDWQVVKFDPDWIGAWGSRNGRRLVGIGFNPQREDFTPDEMAFVRAVTRARLLDRKTIEHERHWS